MDAKKAKIEDFKYKRFVEDYIRSFNIIYKFSEVFGSKVMTPEIISYCLDDVMEILSRQIKGLAKNRTKQNIKKTNSFRAHYNYCLALKEHFDKRKDNKSCLETINKYLENGIKFFKKAGKGYNAGFLEKQLLDVDNIQIPKLDDDLLFVVPISQTLKSNS